MPRKKYFSVLTVFFILLQYFSPLVGLIPVQATGNSNVCPEGHGWSDHVGPGVDGNVEFTAPTGYVVDSVCIKGRSEGSSNKGYLKFFTEDDWYKVTYKEKVGEGRHKEEVTKNCVGASGIEGTTAKAMHGDAKESKCAAISHASFKLARVQGAELVCTPGVNLLKNADFETPVVGTAENWDIVTDGTAGLDWKVEWQSTDTLFEGQNRPEIANLELHKGVNGWLPQTGLQYAELDSDWFGPTNPMTNEPTSVKISQEIATIPGYEYRIEYHFSPRPGTSEADNKLVSAWDSVTLDTHTGAGAGNTAWTKYTKTAEATSEKAVVSFMDDGTPNSLGTFIDNVSVECVGPVPTDTPTPTPMATLFVKKYECSEGSVLNKTSFSTGEVDLNENQIRPDSSGLVNGIAFDQLDDDSFAGCVEGESYTFEVDQHPEDTAGGGSPTGPVVPLDDVITDGNGDGVLSNIEYKGRLEVRELKDDPSRILGFACYRNGEGHGDISNYGEYALFNEDREAYCVAFNKPEARLLGDVTVCKQDNQNNYLPGWNVQLLGKKLETVEVKPDDKMGDPYTPSYSSELPEGDYVLVARGTYKYRGGTELLTDPAYSERLESDGFVGPYIPWINVMDLTTTGALGVTVNDDPADWGYFSPANTYARGFENYTGEFKFTSFDNNITDNEGSMYVDIYEGYAGFTEQNGCVTFEDVPYGNYKTDEILMQDWENVSGKATQVVVDSETETFTLTNRQVMGTIEGMKYEDANADGQMSDGEKGLEDWQIVIKPETLEPIYDVDLPANSPTGVNTGVLASEKVYLVEVEGTYSYSGLSKLADAEYYSTDNWSNSADFADNPGRDMRTLDVVIDDQNIEWGAYNSDHLYKTIVKGDGTSANFRIFDQDYDPAPPSWYNDNAGTLEVRVYDVTNHVVETDEDGEYTKEVENGEYQVVEINQPGWIQTEPSTSYCHLTITNGNTQTCNFGNTRMGSIDGYKLEDTDGDGTLTRQDERLEGWEINLWTGDENDLITKIDTKTTNSDGYYKFDNLLPGIYWVTETQQEGWTQTAGPAKRGPLYIEVGTDLHGNNFGNFQLGRVEGYKWEDVNADGEKSDDESPLSEWRITLEKLEDDQVYEPVVNSLPTEMTDANGDYEFDGLYPGKYKLCEEMQEGWMQTHPQLMNEMDENFDDENDSKCHYFEITTSGQVLVNFNFGNFELGEVSGYKWDDDNGDSLKTYGEPKMAGWTIELRKDSHESSVIDTEVTGELGEFKFQGLLPGTYYLKEVNQNVMNGAWEQTFPVDPGYHEFVIDSSGDVFENMNFGNNVIADILAEKTTTNTTFTPGQLVTYDLRVTNKGTETAHGVEVWDNLPAGMQYYDSSPNGQYTPANNRVTWTKESLDVNEEWTAQIRLLVPADSTATSIINEVRALRSCQLVNEFTTTLVPSIVEVPEPVIEFCEDDPTPEDNIDSVSLNRAQVAGANITDDEESTGNIRGMATSALGKVLGASNSLSDTGRNMSTALILGTSLISAIFILNKNTFRRNIY